MNLPLPQPTSVEVSPPEPAAITPQFVLTPEDLPFIDQIITEDDKPADSILSSKQQRLLVSPLYGEWKYAGYHKKFIAEANVGLFYSVRQPPLVPDMFLSLNVTVADDCWAKQHRAYFFWEFGKPPEIVIEIVTDQEGGEDTSKLRDYASLGILYYVIFDPYQELSDTVLRTYELRDNQYMKMTKPWFPELHLGLKLWTGKYENIPHLWLRWCDQDENLILSSAECAEQQRLEKERALLLVEQERQRAEQERQRAEQERQRAEQERQRKKRLLEKLRPLEIEPVE